jgi:hypothetical protein
MESHNSFPEMKRYLPIYHIHHAPLLTDQEEPHATVVIADVDMLAAYEPQNKGAIYAAIPLSNRLSKPAEDGAQGEVAMEVGKHYLHLTSQKQSTLDGVYELVPIQPASAVGVMFQLLKLAPLFLVNLAPEKKFTRKSNKKRAECYSRHSAPIQVL